MARGGISGYTLFVKENNARIKKDGELQKPGDVMRAAAAEWKALSDEERKRLNERALALRAESPPSSSPSKKAPSKGKKRKVESDEDSEGEAAAKPAAKKSKKTSGYSIFSKEAMKRYGDIWSKLSDKKKEEYSELASKAHDAKASEADGKKPKRKMSGYAYFASENMKKTGDRWRSLSEEEKAEYEKRAERA